MVLRSPCQTDPVVDDSLPPPPPPRRRLALTTRLALAALIAAFVSSFLPWVRVLFISVNGTDGDGMISLVTAGLGIGCVVLVERTTWRPLVAHTGAVVSAAVTSVVFVYNLADVSRAAGQSANAVFDLQVSLQFGLVLGAVAAPIALFATVVGLSDHLAERRGVAAHPWSSFELVVAGLAVSTLPFAVAPSLWAVSALLAIVLAALLLFAGRRSLLPRAGVVLCAVGIVIAAAGTVYGIVDTDDGTTLSSSMTDSLQGIPVDDLEDCADVFAAGTATADVDEPLMCLDSGVETYVFPVTWTCEDGRTLVSNDYGWGYQDDEWSTVGEAPYDRCRSTADKPCTEIFADGLMTDPTWIDDFIECFDENGEIDYVITTRWDCFDSDEVQLSNRYGWGYLGKKWVGGEEAPFC